MLSIKANYVDVFAKKIFPAEIKVTDGRISEIITISQQQVPANQFLLPGFVDAHVHIESSMLVPSEFARLAVVHGTVATVSDPHEIGNVCGLAGVEYMVNNGKQTHFKFNFGAPSCVPATVFETAGARIDAEEVDRLLQKNEIKYLSEMMNFPGVLQQDDSVMQKLHSAIRYNKPIDGHAPGLRGKEAFAYIHGGNSDKDSPIIIGTDHECFTKEEALDKLRFGMKILIREGSAAKNFEALIDLLPDYPDQMMFCSDDKHPDSLVVAHINQLCARAVAHGVDLFTVLQAACVNPVLHYKLEVGLLRINDPADFILVESLETFKVISTYINGELVADKGVSTLPSKPIAPINRFSCDSKKADDFQCPLPDEKNQKIAVIEALDGQLITNKLYLPGSSFIIENGLLKSNPDTDILKIAVVNRYKNAKPAIAFIKNFGLKKGALASSVAHDSHNIVVVGVDDECICQAVNLVIAAKGGISCVSPESSHSLALPVAGLMSNEDGYKVAAAYTEIDKQAKYLGSTLSSPYMTLSFMALLVIPHLKLSDLGLFDGDAFRFE